MMVRFSDGYALVARKGEENIGMRLRNDQTAEIAALTDIEVIILLLRYPDSFLPEIVFCFFLLHCLPPRPVLQHALTVAQLCIIEGAMLVHTGAIEYRRHALRPESFDFCSI